MSEVIGGPLSTMRVLVLTVADVSVVRALTGAVTSVTATLRWVSNLLSLGH